MLSGKTPYQLLHKIPPPYTHIRVLGSLCFARNQHQHGDKFVGYPYGHKGWRLFDLEKREYFVFRDVVFKETEFSYSEISSTLEEALQDQELWTPVSDASKTIVLLSPTEKPHGPIYPSTQPAHQTEPIPPNPSPPVPNHLSIIYYPGSDSDQISEPPSSPSLSEPHLPSSSTSHEPETSSAEIPKALGRRQRKKLPSVTFQNYVTNTVSAETSSFCLHI